MESWIEVALVGMLGATLLHAIRLQRAIKALQSGRESLDDAVAGFDSGARQAEAGLARLRDAADRLGGDLGHASSLKDDLALLAERGSLVADRLEALIRTTRAVDPGLPAAGAAGTRFPQARTAAAASPPAPVRSQAERNLLLALQASR